MDPPRLILFTSLLCSCLLEVCPLVCVLAAVSYIWLCIKVQQHTLICCLQIGALYTEQGQVDQALNTYLEALEHSPENPDILTTLGITFLR